MPCPLYSKRQQECLLLDQAAIDEDDDGTSEADRLRLDLCLGDSKEHLACPVFQRQAIERTKAY